MDNINGYTYDEKKFKIVNGEWTFAEKNGEEFFLKRFSTPKYPSKDMPSYSEKLSECNEWMKHRQEIIDALRKVSDGYGNIVTPLDFFLDKPYYYTVSHKVDSVTEKPEEIAAMSHETRMLIFKTITGSLQRIHSVDIVHGDLKPSNIIISKTAGGNYVSKIIDFDDSYFSQRPPLPDQVVGTEEYWSPELAIYKLTKECKEKTNITSASDIFALGILFHEYCTGKRPERDGQKVYQIVYASALGKAKPLNLDPTIRPLWLRDLISQMLQMDPYKRPSAIEILKTLNDPPKTEFPKIETIDGSKKVKMIFENGKIQCMDLWLAENFLKKLNSE